MGEEVITGRIELPGGLAGFGLFARGEQQLAMLAAVQSGHAAHACDSCMSSAAGHNMVSRPCCAAVGSHQVWCADSFTYTYGVPGFERDQQGFLLAVSGRLPLLHAAVQMMRCRSVLGAGERGNAAQSLCCACAQLCTGAVCIADVKSTVAPSCRC
jgi:hypothetical protein